MTWTRRWGVIGSIAVAQLGIIVGYQALLTGGPSAASAGQVPQTSELPQGPNAASTPPIKLPPMTQTAEPLSPAPGQPPLAVEQPALILPVAAQEAVPPPLPSPLVPMEIQTPTSPEFPKNAPAPSAPATPVACPWNLSLNIVAGRTHLTAQNGKDVKFTVSCDKLDVQTPRGRIEAAGKVKVTSDNLEGSCERLTISWQEEVVVLEKVQLKCKLEGQAADLYAEQLRLKLNRVVPDNTAANSWWNWQATKQ